MEVVARDIFTNIYKNFGFGYTKETRSGPGSILKDTVNIRMFIVGLIQAKKIKTVVDIPCGDLNWISPITYLFEDYKGCDIVPECISDNIKHYPELDFRCLNIIQDTIPEADLLIVRDILGHLPLNDARKALKNILSSGCRILLSTTWAKQNYNLTWSPCLPGDVDRQNQDIDYGGWYPVNLMAAPFSLPMPDMLVAETALGPNYESGIRKTLACWDLSQMKVYCADSPLSSLLMRSI